MDNLKPNQKLKLALHHLELILSESNILMVGDLELSIDLIKQAIAQQTNQGKNDGRKQVRKTRP